MNQRQRQRVAQQANFRCGYCQTQEVISGVPLTVEHILPKARGGSDDEQNLWLSCRLCNEAKGVLVEAIDPQTDATAPLFNPRTQVWAEHFAWADDGAQLIGLTSIGRATIVALSLNSDFRLRSRRIWVEAGYHPPD
jgi:hypothetical protein